MLLGLMYFELSSGSRHTISCITSDVEIDNDTLNEPESEPDQQETSARIRRQIPWVWVIGHKEGFYSS